MINQAAWDFIHLPVGIWIIILAGGSRGFDRVERTIEHHSAWSCDTRSGAGSGEVGIDCLQTHLGVQRSNYEFANRDRSSVMKERSNSKIRVYALNVRRIDRTIRVSSDRSIVDFLTC
jgi:hypothetical protein